MGISKKLGIVNDAKGDINFRKTVKFIQLYGFERGLRPVLVDLYFLIAGRQKGSVKFVSPEYYTTNRQFLTEIKNE